MDEQSEVFISYSSHDVGFVEELVSDLQAFNVKVWWDREKIQAGDSISSEIGQALGSVKTFVIILSQEAIASGYVEKELGAAIEEEVRRRTNYIVPVLHKKCEIPALIRSKHYADFSTDYIAGLKDLLNVLGHPVTDQERLTTLARKAIQWKFNQVPSMRSGFNLGNLDGDLKQVSSQKGTSGFVQQYEKGMIVWHATGECSRKAFAVYGGIGLRYREMEEKRWQQLGFPTTDELDAAESPYTNNKGERNRGRYNLFEFGEIVWCESGEMREQVYALSDPIRKAYDAMGGTGSCLGFPTNEPYSIPYPNQQATRCDFEGGAMIVLSGNTVAFVRQLLRLNYADSPFKHGWKQRLGEEDAECASIRLSSSIGMSKSFVAFNVPWDNRAIMYPATPFPDNELRNHFCGITVKSLKPGGRFRAFINIRAKAPGIQYIELDTHNPNKGLVSGYDDEYLQIPLPAGSTDGNWHTFVIDLEKTVRDGFGRTFEWIKGFHFLGHIGIADLVVSDTREAIQAVAMNPIFL